MFCARSQDFRALPLEGGRANKSSSGNPFARPLFLRLVSFLKEQTSRLKLKAVRKFRAARRRMYPPRGGACDFPAAGGSLIFFLFSSWKQKSYHRRRCPSLRGERRFSDADVERARLLHQYALHRVSANAQRLADLQYMPVPRSLQQPCSCMILEQLSIANVAA